MMIRAFKTEDWKAADRIYAEGAIPGKAVFHQDEPTWEDWDVSHLKSCRLVAEDNGVVIGWTALRPVSDKCVDRGVAKVSTYVAEDYRGKGVGRALLNALIEVSEEEGIWTLQSQIIQENTSSIRLCESCGFRMVGYRERINRDDNGVWHNLVLMERRSKVVEVSGDCCYGQ